MDVAPRADIVTTDLGGSYIATVGTSFTVDWPNDSVCLQVSADGTAWTNLWTPEQSPLMDEGWEFVEYTVPAGSADDRPTVYFRWGLGPTDASVAYGGWNIDDVQVVGDTIGN